MIDGNTNRVIATLPMHIMNGYGYLAVNPTTNLVYVTYRVSIMSVLDGT